MTLRLAGGGDPEGGEDLYLLLTEALGRAARNQHKLGGWPTFVQQYQRPFARQLFQVEARAPFDVNFGDLGAGHLLIEASGDLRFWWSNH